MKLFSVVLASVLALPVLGQMVSFAAPAPGVTLTPGSSIVVELDSANGLTNFQHVSVALGIAPVPNDTSTPTIGTMLFAGNYTPTLHEQNKPMYQNFTLTIPDGQISGNSTLSVAHFYLVGAGLEPILETRNISVMFYVYVETTLNAFFNYSTRLEIHENIEIQLAAERRNRICDLPAQPLRLPFSPQVLYTENTNPTADVDDLKVSIRTLFEGISECPGFMSVRLEVR
ncbi:hypothetical protein ACEPAG_6175 [Sanghuangporus baumii]